MGVSEVREILGGESSRGFLADPDRSRCGRVERADHVEQYLDKDADSGVENHEEQAIGNAEDFQVLVLWQPLFDKPSNAHLQVHDRSRN